MDLIYEGITTMEGYTGFTSLEIVRMDLIYEGITTNCGWPYIPTLGRQNGPDLRRDYDQTGTE